MRVARSPDAGPVRRWFRGISQAGFHRVSYLEWGDPENPDVVVCVHSLTRNARDFDVLATELSARYRVICPDVVGRGESDWVSDANAYSYAQYMADMTALLARLNVERVDWVGTSMGGLIGLLLAAWEDSPITRLVLNDVGAFLPRRGLARIAGYVGRASTFSDLDEAEAYFRSVYAQIGALTDTQWGDFARRSVRALPDGTYRLQYDPAIGVGVRAGSLTDVDLWAFWERVKCPVLILRGMESDLLLPDTAAKMAETGPGAKVIEIPDCGHPPSVQQPEQVALVVDWLGGPRKRSTKNGSGPFEK